MTRSLSEAILGLIREPLAHFLAIGAAIFAVYSATSPEPSNLENGQVVRITDAQLGRVAAQFEKTWRRPPGEQELEGMVDAMVREEILVQEAVELGLDQGDEIVRRRLAQKMEFLLASAAKTTAPDDDALSAFFEARSEIYAAPQQIAFESVFLGETVSETEVETAQNALIRGDAPDTIGQSTILPSRLPLSNDRQIDATFGTGFSRQLDDLEVGEWSAPLRSAYGTHLLRVTERLSAQVPAFEDVRTQVTVDWQRMYAAEETEKLIENLQDQYLVETPDLAQWDQAGG